MFQNNRERALLITLVSVSTLDAATTIHLLRQPGYFEFNSYTAQAIEQVGLVPGVLISSLCQVVFVVAVAKGLGYLSRYLASIAILGAIGIESLAAASNLARCLSWTWFPYSLIQRLLGY